MYGGVHTFLNHQQYDVMSFLFPPHFPRYLMKAAERGEDIQLEQVGTYLWMSMATVAGGNVSPFVRETTNMLQVKVTSVTIGFGYV